jgi:xanthine/uracil permease
MEKLNKRQKRKYSIFAIISLIVMVSIMFFNIYVPYTFNEIFVLIPLVLSMLSSFYYLFNLLVDLPNTY